mmetsp:Transcript_33649/g.106882  ORF Transcript_33649/g.106882 Transcript_33649/m.106882 type:complete len:517 (-) Transcript_33649:583-2133(-)
MCCRVCRIQSKVPSSIIFSCSRRRRESRCKAAKQCMCTTEVTGSRFSRLTSTAMQLSGSCTSVASISRRPTTSQAQTPSTARASSASSASPPLMISPIRLASARRAPKHAKAARNARLGRMGSSGKARRRNTARNTSWIGGDCSASPQTSCVAPDSSAATTAPAASLALSQAITAAMRPKSRAGGTGSKAVAVRARDSRLRAEWRRFDGDGGEARMASTLEAEQARSTASRDTGQRCSSQSGAAAAAAVPGAWWPSPAPGGAPGCASGGGISGRDTSSASRLRASATSFRCCSPPKPCCARAAAVRPRSASLRSSCQLAGGGEQSGPRASRTPPAKWRSVGACRVVACVIKNPRRSARSLCNQASSNTNFRRGFSCGCGTKGSAKRGARLSADSSIAAAGCAARKALRSSKSGRKPGVASAVTCAPLACPEAAAARRVGSVPKCTRRRSSKAQPNGPRASAAGTSQLQTSKNASRRPASKSAMARATMNSPPRSMPAFTPLLSLPRGCKPCISNSV